MQASVCRLGCRAQRGELCPPLRYIFLFNGVFLRRIARGRPRVSLAALRLRRAAGCQRRRLSTKVRYESVHLTLDVPVLDDCLGYVPLPALGEPETGEHLEKGKLHEHIALVSQFKGVLER